MNNYIILHGSFGSKDGNWFPWLKEQLENEGKIVECPQMPVGVGNQNFENWSKVMDTLIINENTTIIAHSIAPIFVCKYLITNKIKVKKLIFVCGFNNYLGIDNDFDAVNKPMFIDNYDDVKNYCSDIVCYYSNNDPYVKYEVEKSFADKLTGKQFIIKNGGHINSESGYTKFEENFKGDIVMQKLIMLGTGHGFVYNCYNTCFVMQNNDKYFLVDTGGSVHIVQNLEKVNISLNKIHDIFISHSHTDHILGLFWILKRMTGMVRSGKYDGKLNIYCNDEVANAIKNIYPSLFPDVYVNEIEKYINIIVVSDNETKEIANRNYTFFDVKASKNKLFGFETNLDNNKKLIFLGDETCNPELYDKIKNSDYIMHEAFCLDSEQNIFKPYEKKHSTVKSVCKNFNDLNVKNLILYHTEDTHLENRKELYMNEAKLYFNNNVLIPNDLEEIKLS